MKKYFAAALVLISGTGVAFAHITLETKEATAGSSYKAVFRVPHGCDGKATTAVRVKVPEGVIDAKPMPKAGWTLNAIKGKYAKSYTLYGQPVSEGVTEIDWTGGSLPDDFYDEFVFRGQLAADLPTDQPLRFPVVQECEGGAVDRWIEIPAAGKDEDSVEFPAPAIKVSPKK
jgi:periplasmic copper chaperone A